MSDQVSPAEVKPLTIPEILAYKQPLMPLWPDFGQSCGLAESTTYQLAAEERLGVPIVRLGRRRYVRTVDAQDFFGLTPGGTGVAPGVQPGAPTGNDEAAGVQPAAPVERSTTSTCK